MYKKLQRFFFLKRPGWYLLNRAPVNPVLNLHGLTPMPHLDDKSSSRFFLQEKTDTLFKLVHDKYSPREDFWRWLGRDIISKRLTGSYDAHKEYQSRRILKKLGQRTVNVRCYGVALNFLNPLGSLYAMEHMSRCQAGSDYYATLDDTSRARFIDTLASQVAALAEAGYYHRDLHLDNLMVDESTQLIWIDTHVKALPSSREKRQALFDNMLTNSRIDDPADRARLKGHLAPYFSSANEARSH
ncbi:hypothetical protein [Halomonas sp. GD1P12]|uniref:hypothetical protein n=1 Tax=Halomonas sp. GD1P12 TaxID=2982691 RepID=UPI0021E35F94|nr:hypothetical protein [Halomonas sp. GD1P12]UYF99847.1 hypothetical protein OCT39_16770 [Halomonas sp. GD1P12]